MNCDRYIEESVSTPTYFLNTKTSKNTKTKYGKWQFSSTLVII